MTTSRPVPGRAAGPGIRDGDARTVRFALTDDEYAEVSAAARQAGLARGAYAAEATLAVARGEVATPDAPLRGRLHALDRAALLVRRIGVNLNQAVAKLNATGQWSGDLPRTRKRASAARPGWKRPGKTCGSRFLRAIRAPGPCRPRGRPADQNPRRLPPIRDDRTAFRAGPPERTAFRAAFRPARNGTDGVPRGPERGGWRSAGPEPVDRGRVSGDREGLPARPGRGRADPLPVRSRTPGGTHRSAYHRRLPPAR